MFSGDHSKIAPYLSLMESSSAAINSFDSMLLQETSIGGSAAQSAPASAPTYSTESPTLLTKTLPPTRRSSPPTTTTPTLNRSTSIVAPPTGTGRSFSATAMGESIFGEMTQEVAISYDLSLSRVFDETIDPRYLKYFGYPWATPPPKEPTLVPASAVLNTITAMTSSATTSTSNSTAALLRNVKSMHPRGPFVNHDPFGETSLSSMSADFERLWRKTSLDDPQADARAEHDFEQLWCETRLNDPQAELNADRDFELLFPAVKTPFHYSFLFLSLSVFHFLL